MSDNYENIIDMQDGAFFGTIQHDSYDHINPYYGKILGLDNEDFNTYQGKTIEELHGNFTKAVEKYHTYCKKELGMPIAKAITDTVKQRSYCVTSQLLDYIKTYMDTDSSIIRPALQDKFNTFLLKPAMVDGNRFPFGLYNFHRTLQFICGYLLDHIGKYGIVRDGEVVYAPQFIPDYDRLELIVRFKSRQTTSRNVLQTLANYTSDDVNGIRAITIRKRDIKRDIFRVDQIQQPFFM